MSKEVFVCVFLMALFSHACWGELNVAFVYGNLPNDLSWTYAVDLARAFVEFSRPDVKTSYYVTDNGCTNVSASLISSLAATDDIDLIIAASSPYESCTMEIAKQYPAKHFVCIGGGQHEGNYASIFGRMYEARYVAGVLAGMTTKTKKIGFIDSIPIYQSFTDVNALLLGAAVTCPDCQVVHYFLDSFFAPQLDRMAAEALITKDNVDVLAVLHNAFDHVAVAEKYNITLLGIDADQFSVAPGVVLTSTYWIWGPMILNYVDGLLANNWTANFIYWGLRENGVGLSRVHYSDHDLNRQLTQQLNTQTEMLRQTELINGTSWIFCGENWAARAPANVSRCLNQTDIITMNYFIQGVDARGVFKPPPSLVDLEYVGWKSTEAIILHICVACAILLVLGSLAFVVYHRATSVVKMSNLYFIVTVTIGIVLTLATAFTYAGKIEDASCILRTWFGGMGIILTLSPIIAKTYRLVRMLSNTAMIATRISTLELFGVTGAIIAIQAVLLLVWSIIPSARLQSSVHLMGSLDISTNTQRGILICRSTHMWPFLGLQIAIVVGCILVGVTLTFLTRKVARRITFREQVYLAYVFLNVTIWLLLWLAGTGFLWDNYKGQFLLCVLALLIHGLINAALILGPKMYVLLFVKGGKESSDTAGGTSEFSTNFRPDADF